jgi:predicted metalloprotease with PDZ domain
MAFSLHHEVWVADPLAHLIDVETTVRAGAPIDALTLFMPVWTPGSYLVREYARHVESLTVLEGAGGRKVRKNAWRVEAKGGTFARVRYRLYCNDLTVRTNHVDETHALLNGAATFLAIEGDERAPATVKLHVPEGWRVSTPLAAKGDGIFEAPDLDTLVDCPIVMGAYDEVSFSVLGKTHTLVVWPEKQAPEADRARLVRDSTTVVEGLARLFGGTLPYDNYRFLLHLSGRGRGGLEHRSCAALIASPTSFGTRAAYLDLVSLIAHETLHAWNVKRIRPEGLTPYRYQEENYTRLLWWFEGATSYFDWHTLRATRLATVDEYLEHLAGEIGQLEATPGRLVSSLEDASFDAWIKLYRPDENSGNSTVSYYRKGEIVCALLDVELLGRTGGKIGLEAVLRHLWEAYGVREVPVPEGAMQEIFERVAGVPMGDLLDRWVRSPGSIDYGPTFARVGLRLERPSAREPASLGGNPQTPGEGSPRSLVRVSLGLKTRAEAGRLFVASVIRGGAAQRAGIDAGDELVYIGGKRVEGSSVDPCLAGHAPGDSAPVLLSRDGRLVSRTVTFDEPRSEKAKLVARNDATDAERALFATWLRDPHPAWAGRKG